MLYGPCYLVVCLLHYICLIPFKDIRLVYILYVLPYWPVVYVQLLPHSLDEILRKGYAYHTGTPWSGNTRCGCPSLVSASCDVKKYITTTYQNGVPWFGECYYNLTAWVTS